jgi:hypothetical protein
VHALRELQRGFARAILAGRAPGFAPAERVQVYRNNVFVSFTQALADVYPAIARLVGEDFFGQAARRYIRAHGSRSGDLHAFGREFPALLRSLRESRELPYLGDVAELEWAWHEAFHAAESSPLDAARLARVPEAAHERLRFRLDPSLRLIASRYPILAIWEANRGEAPPESEIRLDAGADCVRVMRRDLDCHAERLSAGEFALLSELAAGAALAQACEAAAAAQPGIDLGAAMARLVLDRGLVDFTLD